MRKHGWKRGMLVVTALAALAAWSIGPQAYAASTGTYSYDLTENLKPLPTPTPATYTPSTYTYDFEENLKPWIAGTGSLVTLDRGDNLCPIELGTGMALITVPVRNADPGPTSIGGGSAYMMAKFHANPGDTVVVDWSAKGEDACASGGCVPLIYSGANSDPSTFTWTAVSGRPGAYGWQMYHYQGLVSPNVSGSDAVVIALGVSGKDRLTGVSLGVDCVRVSITANTNN